VDGVARTLLSEHGEVHLQMLTLLEQEREIREPAEYRSVLTAIATGRTEVNEIAGVTGLEPYTVRRVLGILGDLDLVRGERNFEAARTAPYRYVVADNAVGFWHRFALPNRGQLATDEPRRLWDGRVAPHLDTYLNRPFEAVVRQAYARYHAAWGLPAATEWGRWGGRDREKRPVELDVVARLEDGGLLAGEIKWSSTPYGPGLHADVLTKLARLALSGHGWAHEADRARFLYVSAAGFTSEMVALTRAEPRIRLLTLDDLYPTD